MIHVQKSRSVPYYYSLIQNAKIHVFPQNDKFFLRGMGV